MNLRSTTNNAASKDPLSKNLNVKKNTDTAVDVWKFLNKAFWKMLILIIKLLDVTTSSDLQESADLPFKY